MIPKFRSWDGAKKEMFKDTFAITESGQVVVVEQEFVTIPPDYVFIDYLVIMQSTGLFDRNGQEIFEGDIVDYKGRKAIIKWHGSYASFIYRFVDEMQERVSEWDPLFLAYHHFEIIGNIYKNPELLEDEK
nr:MAG TPA: YopX protein [Caudoviricetes sp.]